MTFHELDSIVLARNLPEHGLQVGDLGTIVHVHTTEAFEVEFVRASGETQALVTLEAMDLRAIQPHDLVAVRSVSLRPSS